MSTIKLSMKFLCLTFLAFFVSICSIVSAYSLTQTDQKVANKVLTIVQDRIESWRWSEQKIIPLFKKVIAKESTKPRVSAILSFVVDTMENDIFAEIRTTLPNASTSEQFTLCKIDDFSYEKSTWVYDCGVIYMLDNPDTWDYKASLYDENNRLLIKSFPLLHYCGGDMCPTTFVINKERSILSRTENAWDICHSDFSYYVYNTLLSAYDLSVHYSKRARTMTEPNLIVKKWKEELTINFVEIGEEKQSFAWVISTKTDGNITTNSPVYTIKELIISPLWCGLSIEEQSEMDENVYAVSLVNNNSIPSLHLLQKITLSDPYADMIVDFETLTVTARMK